MLFSNIDFNFTHFADFSFAYFEIEKSWVNLGKITKWLISLANFQMFVIALRLSIV